MNKPLRVTRAQARRFERNLSGAPRRKTKPDIGDIMTACQSAAAMAVDLAGLTGRARQDVLLSPALNRHLLRLARELARKLQG